MTVGRRIVMVVEDDDDVRDVVLDGLERRGYGTVDAANGQDALRALRAVVPDVMLVDLTMPVMDGRTFLETVRGIPEMASVPVVVATASGVFADVVDDGLADTVIAKPFGMIELVAAIERVVTRRSRP